MFGRWVYGLCSGCWVYAAVGEAVRPIVVAVVVLKMQSLSGMAVQRVAVTVHSRSGPKW